MMQIEKKLEIMEGFTNTFRQSQDLSIYQREVACLKAQFPAVFLMPQREDLLAGFVEVLPVGFFPQEGGLGYYCNTEMMAELHNSPQITDDQSRRLKDLEDYWSDKTTTFKTRVAYSDDLKKAFPSDDWTGEPGVGFPLYRMGGSQQDYDKLIQTGLVGLKMEICNLGQSEFYAGLLAMLDLLIYCCEDYAGKLSQLALDTPDPERKSQLENMAKTFINISKTQPQNLHEAAQLVMLYNFFSGSFNFGRMDEYFGDIYVNDLERGICEEEELSILISFWKIINRRQTIFDGRVIIGGKGRRNPENADRFAKLALQASRMVNDVLPQLTLRFHKDQDPDLLQIGLDNIGLGCTFPLLYNDDVNIPSVSNAFQISLKEAEHYVPYGCGEYTIFHRSFGTPSGVINLLKALEMAIHNGTDPIDGAIRGLHTGDFSTLSSFEEFYQAYEKQVEYQVAALAVQEKLEYDICASEAPFLALSLLYDDCIENNQPIFDGGIRYLGGTLETYGNSNTGDSLLAIKKLVFEEKRVAQNDLPHILKSNFVGFPIEKAMLKKAPKYGNDIEEADAMLSKIHDHVCEFTREQAEKVGLHSYLVVNINNHANTILGRNTHASADGRPAFSPMANANTPSSGQDKNGITAMLNSIVKPRTDIHAGAVQNIKFSKELFNKNRKVVKELLDTYFDKGGAQAMITVLGKEDLLNAMKCPEKYQNLMVRVGGFSARFVELDRDVQEEILARTLY